MTPLDPLVKSLTALCVESTGKVEVGGKKLLAIVVTETYQLFARNLQHMLRENSYIRVKNAF